MTRLGPGIKMHPAFGEFDSDKYSYIYKVRLLLATKCDWNETDPWIMAVGTYIAGSKKKHLYSHTWIQPDVDKSM